MHAATRTSSRALENRGEETVAAVPMRQQPKRWTRVEIDARARQLCGGILLRELRMRGEKRVDDRIVLFRQDAACRVHEPSAGFDQRGRGFDDPRLLSSELVHIGGR